MTETSVPLSFENEITSHFGFVRSKERAIQVIDEFEIATTSRFVWWHFVKDFGNRVNWTSCDVYKNKRVFWEGFKPGKGSKIPFDGVPFLALRVSDKCCHLGKDKDISKKRKRQEERFNDPKTKTRRSQPSKKVGCQAVINLHEVVKFPAYKIDSDNYLRKKRMSEKLRSDLEEGRAVGEYRIYVELPKNEDHTGHVAGEDAGQRLRVDKVLSGKIGEWVKEGITNVTEVKRLASLYVQDVLFKDAQVPSTSNRRFFPTSKDIMNHVFTHRQKVKFTKKDQENVTATIEQWLERKPEGDEMFFQPYSSEGQQLMFVHQTPWQRHMLLKYGSELALLGVTNKTMKYAFPFFFVAVKTNVDYQVVASFVVQDVNQATIMQALETIKGWTGAGWDPKHFMVPYSEPELNAVQSCFPWAKTFISEFHCEQAWDQWMSDSDNDVGKQKEGVLNCLKLIGNATTEDLFHQAVNALKGCDIWGENEKLRDWLNTFWLSKPEHWVWAYQEDRFLVNVRINNGLERLNRMLKYDFLQHHRDKSLSKMITVLLEQYLPQELENYIDQNGPSSSTTICVDGESVPLFMRDRPRQVYQYLKSRSISSAFVNDVGTSITDELVGTFSVTGTDEKEYILTHGSETEHPNCSCDDFQRHFLPCKHFFALWQRVATASWYSLPAWYRQSVFLTVDTAVQILPEEEDTNAHGLEANSDDENDAAHLEFDLSEDSISSMLGLPESPTPTHPVTTINENISSKPGLPETTTQMHQMTMINHDISSNPGLPESPTATHPITMINDTISSKVGLPKTPSPNNPMRTVINRCLELMENIESNLHNVTSEDVLTKVASDLIEVDSFIKQSAWNNSVSSKTTQKRKCNTTEECDSGKQLVKKSKALLPSDKNHPVIVEHLVAKPANLKTMYVFHDISKGPLVLPAGSQIVKGPLPVATLLKTPEAKKKDVSQSKSEVAKG